MTIKFINKLNNKHNYFTSKEHYLKFRKSWKTFINEGSAKCVYEQYTEWATRQVHKYKVSYLSAQYHMLYCLLIGKDISTIFKFKDVGVEEKYKFWTKKILRNIIVWNDEKQNNFRKYLNEHQTKLYVDIFQKHITPETASRLLEELEKAPE